MEDKEADLTVPIAGVKMPPHLEGSTLPARKGTPDVLLTREVELHRELKEVQSMRNNYMAGGRAALMSAKQSAAGLESRLHGRIRAIRSVRWRGVRIITGDPDKQEGLTALSEFFTPVPLPGPLGALPPVSPKSSEQFNVTQGGAGQRLPPPTQPPLPMSSGYSQTRLSMLPGMKTPPAPIKLLSSTSAVAMQREIDALRASSEKYDSFAKAQRAKWHSGTAHPDRGQKMLREGHKANLQMAKKKQLGIDADLDYAFVQGAVFDWEGKQLSKHMETREGLAVASRGPIVAHLQQTSSAPNLATRYNKAPKKGGGSPPKPQPQEAWVTAEDTLGADPMVLVAAMGK